MASVTAGSSSTVEDLLSFLCIHLLTEQRYWKVQIKKNAIIIFEFYQSLLFDVAQRPSHSIGLVLESAAAYTI